MNKFIIWLFNVNSEARIFRSYRGVTFANKNCKIEAYIRCKKLMNQPERATQDLLILTWMLVYGHKAYLYYIMIQLRNIIVYIWIISYRYSGSNTNSSNPLFAFSEFECPICLTTVQSSLAQLSCKHSKINTMKVSKWVYIKNVCNTELDIHVHYEEKRL